MSERCMDEVFALEQVRANSAQFEFAIRI